MIRLLLALLLLGASSARAADAPVLLIDVQGTINPGSADFIRTSLLEADRRKAQALVVRLNTPGGLLTSTREIVQYFSESPLPVVIWVAPGGASATSAGAIISVAAHLSAMAPGTNIGAAHPVGPGGQEPKGAMNDKITNDTAAMVRAQALLRKRNVDLSEKVVTKSTSLTVDEAVKENLVNFVAADETALLRALDGRKVWIEKVRADVTLSTRSSGEMERLEMSAGQKFLHFIADPNISTMLIALAGVAIYAEVSSGFTLVIPGLVGVFCALLGGVGLSMLPINLGGVFLFGLGIALLVAEVFVTSFGLLFIGGLASIFIGALFLIDPSGGNIRVSMAVLLPILGGVGVVGLIIAWLLKKERTVRGTPFDPIVSQSGRVEAVEPSGKSGSLFIHGELWAFDSEDSLQAGDHVVVVSRHNLKLNVKKR